MFTKRSNRHSSGHSVMEALEGRRLLSADLAPLFSELPLSVNPGDRNHVAIEVLNNGPSTAAGTAIVDLSAQSTTGGPDVLLEQVTRNVNLKAGRGEAFNFRFASPPSLGDGSYNLVAELSTATINDAVTSNDVITSAAPVTITQPFSDVTTESVNAPAHSLLVTASPRQQHASITLENNGNVPAQGRISVAFYLSQNSILDRQAEQAGSIVVPINLKPGQIRVVRSPIDAPANSIGGQYYLFAVATPVSGNVQSQPGHGVGIAINQVNVTVIQKIVFFRPPVCYSGPDYQCTPGHVGGTECTVDSGSSDDGSADGFSTDTGTTNVPPNDGSTYVAPPTTGSTDSGSPDAGTTDNGATDNNSPDGSSPTSAPTNGGPTNNGYPTSAPTNGGSTDNGSADGSSTDGSTDSGSTNDGSTDTGSTDDGSSDGGSYDTGSTDSGSDNSVSTDDGSDDSGSTDDGSDDSGSSDDSSGGDETDDSFIARRSAKSPSQKEHTVSHAVPTRPLHVRL